MAGRWGKHNQQRLDSGWPRAQAAGLCLVVPGDLLGAPPHGARWAPAWGGWPLRGPRSEELAVFADQDGHQVLDQRSACQEEGIRKG